MGHLPTIIPQDDPAQALRVRRLLVGSITYLMTVSQALLCWWFGYLELGVLLFHAVMVLSINITFYAIIRSGRNQRFADPSLTLPQLLIGVATGLFLMYFTHQARVVFMLMSLPIFLYGIFQFRRRDFYLLTALTMAGYGILLVLLYLNRPEEVNLELGFMIAIAISIMLLQMSELAGYIAHMRWKITDKNRELGKRNIELLERSDDLQRAHQDVAHALDTLRLAHDELVRKEKLAALGALVAGVAHEINTPVGNSLMAVSMLENETKVLHDEYLSETGMRRTTLENYLHDAGNSCTILQRNLQRVADLVTSFKQVSIDQTSSQRRSFQLLELVDEINLMLAPMLKNSPIVLQYRIDDTLVLDSYPGPLGQAMNHLIANALIHAFDGREKGNITVEAHHTEDDWVELSVKDDGVGISAANLPRIFDPFFTTKFGTGGSGLGLNITHNIVTGIMGGRMRVVSSVDSGTHFILTLPLVAPQRLGNDAEF